MLSKEMRKDNENTECNILKRKRAPISFPTSVHYILTAKLLTNSKTYINTSEIKK